MMKRGQFFLVAALIIVIMILGLSAISISTRVSKEDFRIFDLTNEIDLEGRSVVDHGIFTGTDIDCKLHGEAGKDGCIEDGIFRYYAEANPDSGLTIIYGDPGGYTIVNSTQVDQGFVDLEGRRTTISDTEITIETGDCGEGITSCDVTVNLDDDTSLTFVIGGEGSVFYVVIIDEEEDTEERTVATNE